MCDCICTIDEINYKIRSLNRYIQMENMTNSYYIHVSCDFCDNSLIEIIFNRLNARECPKCDKVICNKCDQYVNHRDIEWNIYDDDIDI